MFYADLRINSDYSPLQYQILLLITETECDYCAVRNGTLNIFYVNLRFLQFDQIFHFFLLVQSKGWVDTVGIPHCNGTVWFTVKFTPQYFFVSDSELLSKTFYMHHSTSNINTFLYCIYYVYLYLQCFVLFVLCYLYCFVYVYLISFVLSVLMLRTTATDWQLNCSL